MSSTLLLTVGIFVFAMMLVGLVLTVREFRYGEPSRQAEEANAEARPRPRAVKAAVR